MKNAWKMVAGAMLVSAMMVGCKSTQCRDGACTDKVACKGECDGNCEGKGDCAGACKDVACSHMNAKIDCPNCKPGEPCCANCEKKMKAACPDCKGKDS